MKNRKLTIPAALMLMLLAVVCTFNITNRPATAGGCPACGTSSGSMT